MVLVEVPEQVHQAIRGRGIEICRRLVGQNQGWPRHDRPGDGDALLLTAGHVGRPPVLQALEADLFEDLQRQPAPLRSGHALHLHDELDILPRRQHGDEVEGLEHEADLAESEVGQLALGQVVDAAARDIDLAAIRLVEAADRVEKRGLAAARRGRQADEATLGDLEAHVIEGFDVHIALAVGSAQVNATYCRHDQTFVMASMGW